MRLKMQNERGGDKEEEEKVWALIVRLSAAFYSEMKPGWNGRTDVTEMAEMAEMAEMMDERGKGRVTLCVV